MDLRALGLWQWPTELIASQRVSIREETTVCSEKSGEWRGSGVVHRGRQQLPDLYLSKNDAQRLMNFNRSLNQIFQVASACPSRSTPCKRGREITVWRKWKAQKDIRRFSRTCMDHYRAGETGLFAMGVRWICSKNKSLMIAEQWMAHRHTSLFRRRSHGLSSPDRWWKYAVMLEERSGDWLDEHHCRKCQVNLSYG